MSSGVPVNPDCITIFQELKLKKKYNYIIFGLSPDLSDIGVLKTGVEKDYNDFLDILPQDECRWAVYDFEFEKEEGGRRNKITFVSWSPDDAKIKQKMLYASSRDALKRSLTGIAIEIQGSDLSEVSYDIVLEKANRSA